MGTADLVLPAGAITITGTHASMFTASGITLPATIAGGSFATFTISFDPTSAGLKTAAVNIANNDCDENPYDFAIQGTGVEPEIDIAALGISIVDGDITPSVTDNTDFGNVAIGVNTQSYVISNTGSTDLTIPAGGITITGPDAANFTLGVIALPVTIVPGGFTNFSVTFSPTSAGLKTSTVNVANNDCNENPYNFAIQGMGVDPCAGITIITCNTPVTATSSGYGAWNPAACALATGPRESI